MVSSKLLNETSIRRDHEAPDHSFEDVSHDDSLAVDELVHEMQTLDVKLDQHPPSLSPVSPMSDHVRFADDDQADANVSDLLNETGYYRSQRNYYNESQNRQEYFRSNRNSSPFQYNKRQTGKKNVSSIVVGSDNKIEFDQLDDKGFGVVKIHRPIGLLSSRSHEYLNDSDSINSRDSERTHTADGFFDLKFYSHPLW